MGMWLVDWRISKRLIDLSKRIEKIGHAGGEAGRLPAQGRDEIGELAAVFNALLERTQQSEKHLSESEQRLRILVDHMPVMVGAIDEQRRIIFWNKECERVTGYSASEIIDNREVLEMLLLSPYDNVQLPGSKFLRNGRDQVLLLTTKDGERRKITYSNVAGECPIPGWHRWAVGVDITEQDAALEALRKSERDFQNLVENSPDLIVRFDR